MVVLSMSRGAPVMSDDVLCDHATTQVDAVGAAVRESVEAGRPWQLIASGTVLSEIKAPRLLETLPLQVSMGCRRIACPLCLAAAGCVELSPMLASASSVFALPLCIGPCLPPKETPSKENDTPAPCSLASCASSAAPPCAWPAPPRLPGRRQQSRRGSTLGEAHTAMHVTFHCPSPNASCTASMAKDLN